MQPLALASTVGGASNPLEVVSLDRRMVFAAVAQQLLGAAAPPVTIGRFVLVDRLGSGSFGTVYSAFDPLLQRRVALKLVDGIATDDSLRARVEREAQAAAGLSHPNVVTVHDVGDVDGRVYIAMEFVEGTTLSAWCRAQPRSWREIAEMFVAIASGLHAAHAAGIVHRDFKPDNVLVGKDGRPRIADFGLARAQLSTAVDIGDPAPLQPNEGTTSGGVGGIAGTPAYMAPEQFAGRGIGPASDQFAFSVALFEAVFGRRPFAGSTVVALAREVMSGRIATTRRGVPRSLLATIRRGLAVCPSDRHPSMATYADALRRILARRARVAFAAVALVLAGIGTAAGAGLGTPPPDPCEGVEAEIADHWSEERRDAIIERAHADAAWSTVIEHVDAYADTWRESRREACAGTMVRGERSPMSMELRNACLDRRLVGLETFLDALDTGFDPQRAVPLLDDARGALAHCSDDAALANDGENRFLRDHDRRRDFAADAAWREGSEQLEHAQALALLGRSGEAGAIARTVAAETNAAGLRAVEAKALLVWAGSEMAAGELDDTHERLDRAIELAVAAGSSDVAVDALLGRVQLSLHRGAIATSDEVRLQLAGALLERVNDAAQRRVRLLELRGQVASSSGDADGAESWLSQAVDEAATAYRPDHPNAISPRNNLASIALARGEYERAHLLWSAVLADASTSLGEHHPDAVAPAFNLGVVELERGRPADAAPYFALARLRWTASVGPMHPLVALALGGQGEAMRKSGRTLAARVLQTESLLIREQTLGHEHPDVAVALEELAILDRLDGNWAQAHERLDRALEIRTAAQGDNHLDLAIGLKIRAEVFCDEGRPEEALAPIARALRLRARPGLDPAKSLELHPIALRAMVATGKSV